jgi:hypothetical protein
LDKEHCSCKGCKRQRSTTNPLLFSLMRDGSHVTF